MKVPTNIQRAVQQNERNRRVQKGLSDRRVLSTVANVASRIVGKLKFNATVADKGIHKDEAIVLNVLNGPVLGPEDNILKL